MVASLKRSHFEIQETDVRRTILKLSLQRRRMAFVKKDGIRRRHFFPQSALTLFEEKNLNYIQFQISGLSRKIMDYDQEWEEFSMGLSHIWGEIWQRGYSRPLWLVFCENLEVRSNHFPFLTDLLWRLEHNGWNSSSASFTQWLAPNPKGPLRSVWLWKNKDKTVCGLIEISERLLQLNVNNNLTQQLYRLWPPF